MTDDFTNYIIKALSSAGFWLPISMILALMMVQIVKGIVKDIVPRKYLEVRKHGTRLTAFIIGYCIGIYFIDSPDTYKWSIVVGLTNPTLYIILKSISRTRNIIWLQAALKMRPATVSKDGTVTFDPRETMITHRSLYKTQEESDNVLRAKLEKVAKEHNNG